MARRGRLPDLSGPQVVALHDALLSNADRLLSAAARALEDGDAPLAQTLAILGMEESGKAIALHERRRAMEYRPEGEAFVDSRLQKLWRDHREKLAVMHGFLVEEEYWFGTDPSDPEKNAEVLGHVADWRHRHDVVKQQGFYVDVDERGELMVPRDAVDPEIVARVVAHVHQIGWQLRLGEHIEGKRQLRLSEGVPGASKDEIRAMEALLSRAGSHPDRELLDMMREGEPGQPLNSAAYAW